LRVEASAALPRPKSPRPDRHAGAGPAFEFLEAKLQPPWTRPGIVPRTALVARLARTTEPVVCLVTPPGYGKTTLLAQWAESRGGRVAWVTVDRRDNDPVVLLSYIAAALDRVEPVDPAVFEALAAPAVSVLSTVLPRFSSWAARLSEPVSLMLDNVEALGNRESLDAVAELSLRFPPGSQLVIASRSSPRLPVALLRVQGRMVELGPADLAMDEGEARDLLEGAGVRTAGADTAELIDRTEGWPVGLYLAALALKAGAPRASAVSAFRGDDRLLADYLQSELLARVSRQRVSFLTRSAVLERMSGPLCDAVLVRSGSSRMLESLERSNLLLVALDRHRGWYRYHRLFHELLQAELERREPELVEGLHARAAAWCEANGLPEMAIEHAQAAGDADRVARLVTILGQPAYAAGRVETVRRWLAWFEDRGLVERYPGLAVLGTYLQALLGLPAAAERWAAAAERAPAGGKLPDGSTVESWVALARALLCRDGVDRMRIDAQAALAGLAPASTWQAPALLLEGISFLLDGQPDRADAILARATDVAVQDRTLPSAVTALGERAVVAVGRRDWDLAAALVDRALEIVRAGRLEDYPHTALVHAVAARTALHRGDGPGAREQLARVTRLRPLLTYGLSFFAVQALLELGRAYLALDDKAGVRTALRQARDILQQRPDLGDLPAQVQDLQQAVERTGGPGGDGASSLTTAELRLLPLLPTHLTFHEIADRLYLSKNTVKTQAISIYRKLGVSSRSGAVQGAQETGLL
jgi:LuxR family maltose regulon positive regulatory protein